MPLSNGEVAIDDATGVALIGQRTSANSLPVVVATDQTPISTSVADVSGSQTLSGVGSATVTTTGCSTVVFTVAGSSLAGTYVFEGQNGSGTWVALRAWLPANGTYVTSTTFGNFSAIVQCGGYNQVRIRVSAYTSGTGTINYNAGIGQNVSSEALVHHNGAPLAIVDRATMTPGSQPGLPMIGQSSNVGRIARVTRGGTITPGYQTLLAMDPVEGSTINSWLWTQSAATMTIAQTSGLLVLNNNSTLTTTTYAIITSNKRFPVTNQSPIGCSFRAIGVNNTSNAFVELGLGAPTTTTAIINDGGFFRITSFGTVVGVVSYNGVESSNALASLGSTSYYLFVVIQDDNGYRFIIEDSSGIPIVDTMIALGLTVPDRASVSHLPAFARVYNSGTASAAAQLKISSFQTWQYDINTSKLWSEQLAGAGRSANVDPTTYAQTMQLAAGAAPTATTPTNTTCAYTTLGGEFSLNGTASSENLLGVFGHQIPSPYNFCLTDVIIQPPFVTTALGATINIQEWCLMVASSNNPSTATGQRYPLSLFSAVASAGVGTVFSGQPLNMKLTTPIVVLPGQYLLVLVKVISGAASGVYRGSVFLNGYYE